MTDQDKSSVEAPTSGQDREYTLDESGTLEHLLDECQDAALGHRISAEIFAHDTDLANLFRETAEERDQFCTQLAFLLSREERDDAPRHTGTFWGKVFHWRLQLARSIQLGYREVDDRRINLHIIRRGADHLLHAYEQAERRQLSPRAREEVHRQAEMIRATNHRIHRLAAE